MSFSEDLQKSREKKIEWIGPSEKELAAFPPEIKKKIGHHLWLNQKGQSSSQTEFFTPTHGAPSKGNKIREIGVEAGNPAYRVAFANLPDAIYVLHAFTKSSTETPSKNQKIIAERHKIALRASEEACCIRR